MKKIVLLFILSGIFIFTLPAQKGYKYPVVPGSEKWKSFASHQEMIDACQIPEETLKSLSTKDLILACLDYPLLGDMFFYNSLQDGFNSVKSDFNGLQALLVRPDLAKEMVRFYKAIDPASISSTATLLEKGIYSFRISSVEILLAQNEVLDKLNKYEKKDLLGEAISKLKSKKSMAEVYSVLGNSNTILIMARILDKEKDKSFADSKTKDLNIKSFVEKVYLPDPSVSNEISKMAVQFNSVR